MDYAKKAASQLIYGFASLIGIFPQEWAKSMAMALGRAWYLLDQRHRKVALDNLTRAYVQEKNPFEIKAMAGAVFQNMARIPFEISWTLRRDTAEFIRHCRVNGLGHLRQAHDQGKGVLVLTLHIGNWELLPMSFIAQGFKASMVYRPLDFGPADTFFLQYRGRFGGNPIPKKRSMRKLLKALKHQNCVGVLLDQNSGLKSGVFADFFGYPACTSKGLALLALKTRAPVIPAFLVRRELFFEVFIGPEIPLIQTGEKKEDIRLNTRQYNKVLENIVRNHPEQWLWMHRRWKNRPPHPTTEP
jgi:Kdo2-lipid IVA lauroyltransferase/acyltransferase